MSSEPELWVWPEPSNRVELTLSLLEEGDCVDSLRSVLRRREDPDTESIRGRILSAYLGGPIDSVGMKWIGSFPSDRERGIPRATALIILNDAVTGVPVALMQGSASAPSARER